MERYLYEAPPKPEAPADGAIVIPEEEGYAATVLVHENGMTTYLRREIWDRDAARRAVEFINHWLTTSSDEYVGLPHAQYEDYPIWVPRWTLLHLMNVHDATIMSPLARPKMGGKVIEVVPGTALPIHGQKRR